MRIVIVGAGYAGVTCALRLARRAGDRARITLVNASDRFVERIRLHQQAAGARPPEHDLARLLRGTGVDLRIGKVDAVDLEGRAVTIGEERLPWDRLVLALGSVTDRDAVPGVRAHALTLDASDARRLADAARAAARRSGRVVVVGGGLTGVETAAELADVYPALRVTLLSRGPVGDGWSDAGRRHLVAALTARGVAVREGVGVSAVGAAEVETGDGPVPHDLVVWSVGFVAPPLPRDAGLAVNARGQVRVDRALRSVSHPDVFVAGDLAAPVEPPGDPLPMGCKSAGPTGAFVAENLARALAGEPLRAFDYQVPFYCVSLGRRDGLVQFPGPDGTQIGRVLTGRRAAWFKELICRSTVWVLHLERLGLDATKWGRTGRVPAFDGARPKELAA